MAYLPPTYDDKSFIDEVLEADRRDNNTNNLLNSLDKENAELEKIDCAAVMEAPPDVESGEYFILPTFRERKKLLVYEHSKGHYSSVALLNTLKRKCTYWSSLKSDSIQLVRASTLPGDSGDVDLTGLFVTFKCGNEYLLVRIHITIAAETIDVICTFGPMRKLRSDHDMH
ncbi:hypothetical protein G6F37_011769 [Rhizopus arrhizus]|nr:hypothetical protein G6F38_011847 [Rhizopus arrhizus]KAG1147528.1 hypothetical protein G6F37_011769 [Rhizopus arrhizus]